MIRLFLKLASPDKNGFSRIVSTDEFVGSYESLKLGNGGSWCRFDGSLGKKYKLVTMKHNGRICYSWSRTQKEESELTVCFETYIQTILPKKGNSIKYLKLHGLQMDTPNRPISQKIREFYKNSSCVVCGSNHNVEIDHKNGLYNDPRVLNTNTQTIDDFQPLCNHCNLQKRQTIKKMKETKQRYSALNIPMLKSYNLPFTQGDETFDEKDPNWGIGTFWHDPVDFITKCQN